MRLTGSFQLGDLPDFDDLQEILKELKETSSEQAKRISEFRSWSKYHVAYFGFVGYVVTIGLTTLRDLECVTHCQYLVRINGLIILAFVLFVAFLTFSLISMILFLNLLSPLGLFDIPKGYDFKGINEIMNSGGVSKDEARQIRLHRICIHTYTAIKANDRKLKKVSLALRLFTILALISLVLGVFFVFVTSIL